MPIDTDKYVLRAPADAPRRASYQIDYAGELNPAQYQVAIATQGPVLVIAGAGTGKTRTLVYRVARLVESGVDPAQILLLTFTRKAAEEMLRRASTLLDGRCEHVSGGTFHSFANTVLRRHGKAIGLEPSFTILDRGDAEDVINLLRAEAGLDTKDKRFPRKQVLAEMYSMAINKAVPVAMLIESDYPHLIEHSEELLALAARYTQYKRDNQLADYDDLLVRTHELLRDHEDVRRRLSLAHRYIMVDEYQDTNALQAQIVRLLASEHDNVLVVGDDAQSIYSFRGADFRNIMDFPSLFPGTRVLPLEENYRSTQPILDLTNTVIAAARERYTKNLFTRKPGGAAPILVAAESERFQSRFVCQRVLELREEGVPLHNLAVLFRSSFHSFDLELELARHDIPFVKRGGFKFIETAHVKDVVAFLRIVLNPRDAVSWHRILQLIEGIGPRSSEEIVRWLAGNDPVLQLRSFPKASIKTDLQALAALLVALRADGLLPAQTLEIVLKYYDATLKRVYRDDSPKRRRDLDQLVAIAARYQALPSFLADLTLEPPTDSMGEALVTEPDDEVLTLSTIHSAKGLEWHAVFILWAAEGRFPSTYTLDEDSVEEERRLFYVAATRAQEELYVTYPINVFDRSLGYVLGKPSRFVADIPPDLLRPLLLVEGQPDRNEST